jgi:hypothetical protein
MAYGGLRGAVGFSLVTILPDGNPFKSIFLTATIVMIFFTCFVQGGTIKFVVDWLHIQKKSTEVKSMSADINQIMFDHVMVIIPALCIIAQVVLALLSFLRFCVWVVKSMRLCLCCRINEVVFGLSNQ